MCDQTPPPPVLTPRQKQIVDLIAAGHSTKKIAALIGITPLTARKHRANILLSLKLGSAAALTAYAIGSVRNRAEVLAVLPANLTRREIEVAACLSEGLTSKQIARRLEISDFTVRKHRENLYKKMSADTLAGLLSERARSDDPPSLHQA